LLLHFSGGVSPLFSSLSNASALAALRFNLGL
jgi:hypothetical protein